MQNFEHECALTVALPNYTVSPVTGMQCSNPFCFQLLALQKQVVCDALQLQIFFHSLASYQRLEAKKWQQLNFFPPRL